MPKSPTSRTMEVLRKSGIRYSVAESTNMWSGTKKDLFGFIDLVALHPDRIVGIQVTGGGNLSSRRAKILGPRRDAAKQWLQSGGGIEIHDWRKVKVKRGGKAMRWDCRVEHITLQDFEDDRWDSV